MAQGTFREMAREVMAYNPKVPYSLARRWVRDRYRSICENYLWSFKLAQGQFGTNTVYSTGTVTMTNNSTTVTGSGTTWTSAMTGRQFKVDNFVFTFTYVGATSGTIDRTWLNATEAGLSYSILNAYFAPSESDFHSFISIIDPANGWRLYHGFTAMELDQFDVQRTSSSTPRIVASRTYNSSNVPQFEIWPHPTTQATYPYLYEKRVADLSADADTPPAIIRSDVIVKGALAELARWPGTTTERNPFFDPYLTQYKARELEFQAELNRLLTTDQNIYLTDLMHFTTLPYAPLDANYLQKHAF